MEFGTKCKGVALTLISVVCGEQIEANHAFARLDGRPAVTNDALPAPCDDHADTELNVPDPWNVTDRAPEATTTTTPSPASSLGLSWTWDGQRWVIRS